jgi:hypothetical protein
MTQTDTVGPRTWEEACNEALTAVLAPEAHFATDLLDLDRLEVLMAMCLDSAAGLVRHGGRVAGFHSISDLLAAIGSYAWHWMKVDGYDRPLIPWMVDKLAEKQANYGTGNILAFGEQGLVVRVSDKIARITNMRAKGRNSSDESLFDSLFDLIGYAVIARMLDRGTFELPLTRDTPEGLVLDELAELIDDANAAEQARVEALDAKLRTTLPWLHEDSHAEVLESACQLDYEADDIYFVNQGPWVYAVVREGAEPRD